MKLIINADDLGISSHVNSEIFGFISQWKISSATVLANGPAVEEACETLREFPKASFGAHLNLTEFSPLVMSRDISPLLDDHGLFKLGQVRKTSIDSHLRRAIYMEWNAQIKRLFALGVPISHIDSHQHVHTIPMLLPVLRQLLRDFNIRRIRISRNQYAGDSRRPGLLIRKRIYNFALRNYANATTTAGFTCFTDFYNLAKSGRQPFGLIEAMVHPGLSGESYVLENELLKTGWEKEINTRFELISYNDI